MSIVINDAFAYNQNKINRSRKDSVVKINRQYLSMLTSLLSVAATAIDNGESSIYGTPVAQAVYNVAAGLSSSAAKGL